MVMARLTIILAFLISCFSLHAQHTSFSHQTAFVRYQDSIQLVANIGQHHHLFVMRPSRPPVLYIYDRALNLIGNRELPFRINNAEDVQILPLSGFYYLYLYEPNGGKFRLWRISEFGETKEITAPLKKLVSAEMDSAAITPRLSTFGGQLYLMSHKYFPDLGQVVTTLVLTDDSLRPVEVKRAGFEFDLELDRIQQVMVIDRDHILMLKQGKREGGIYLEMFKIDMNTGVVAGRLFNTSSYVFSQPRMVFNPDDSTTVLHALVTEAIGNRPQRNVFLTKLDRSLNEIIPSTLHRFTSPYYFVLPGDPASSWLCFFNGLYAAAVMSRDANWQRSYDPGGLNAQKAIVPPRTYGRNGRDITKSIKISLLNSRFRMVRDSFIINDDKYPIIPDAYGNFKAGGINYLLMKQRLPSKSVGLLLVYPQNGKLVTTDIPVYNRYEYLLPQVQETGDGSVLIPYVFKQEAGLMKLSTSDLDEVLR
jgi:hypothetical protein